MITRLGINTGFALNRFTTPQEWIPLVAETFGLKIVQFTADLLNPALPDEIVQPEIAAIQKLSQEYGIEIKYTFTSAFTRVNHLAHPNPCLREYWVNWFCKFADISRALGAEGMGSHFGILTVADYKDIQTRQARFAQNVAGWKEVANHAAKIGLKYLLWEPMSIPREIGETISEAKRVQKLVNDGIAIPMKLCLDLDHGDVSSPNPEDSDPYAWIREFGVESPLIHLKQTLQDKGGHWPFIPEKNKLGKITPERLLKTLEESGVEEVTLLLELSFREREPFESRVIEDIKTSVEYWRPYVTI
ncbi:MAG: TIM barrel protein [Candidatus Schekmanbacteria bacterium]|nr:TIM barrel protein [Candidatus Schekmanbacteria bacterium]